MPGTPPPRAKPGVDLSTFLLHWGFSLFCLLSLLTGLRIASDYEGSWAGALARKLLGVLPEGRIIELHVAGGWLVTFVAVVYAGFLWRSREAARVMATQADLRSVSGWRTSPVGPSAIRRWFSLNRLVFQIGFFLVGLLAITGWLLYKGPVVGLSTRTIAQAHGLAAWGIVGYVVIHVFVVVKAGAFWKMLRPRSLHLAIGAIVAVVAAMGLGGYYLVHDQVLHRDLIVPRVDSPPVLRGDGSDPAWARAQSVEILTSRGANLPNGESTVQVRAVHDGGLIYFQFRWNDPQRSQKMHPLIKTEAGWRVLQSGLDRNDENEYYEDKFAAMFSYRPALGSGTVHLGQDLVEGPHYRNPRGLHFSRDESIVDLWHWKSLRSGGMTPGHIDDNYVGPLLPPVAPGTRYTGGYTQDPPGAPHPYLQNWTVLEPGALLADAEVVPRFLPSDPADLDRMGQVDLDPTAHDDGIWFMTIDEVIPYDPALDHFPVGTVLPGIVLSGPFEGDRGDVLAEARWEDGYWTLEASRRLDTGSDYDVAFGTGRDVYLWVAVFNHTQTRHSQHLHPLRVVLE